MPVEDRDRVIGVIGRMRVRANAAILAALAETRHRTLAGTRAGDRSTEVTAGIDGASASNSLRSLQ